MDVDRVVERRRLTGADAIELARILGRHEDLARQLARVSRSGDPEEGAALMFRLLGVLPDIAPWLASLYGIDEQTLRNEPIERLVDYVEGLVKGDDWTSFLARLLRLFGAAS